MENMRSNANKSQHEGMKIVAQNRAASYNYHLLDSLEAGLVLSLIHILAAKKSA